MVYSLNNIQFEEIGVNLRKNYKNYVVVLLKRKVKFVAKLKHKMLNRKV